MGKIHQIFIGCPYARSIRRHYDKSKLELEKETARGRRSSTASSTGDGASGCWSRSSASEGAVVLVPDREAIPVDGGVTRYREEFNEAI